MQTGGSSNALGDSGNEHVAGRVGIELCLRTDFSQTEHEVCASGVVLGLFFFFVVL